MTVRLTTGRTHLFPGARLRADGPLPPPPAAVTVAFADGVEAPARLEAEGRLSVAAHVTAKGTAIPAKAWRLEAEAEGWRVAARFG